MTSCGLILGDGDFPVTTKSSVVVEVAELTDAPPATEDVLVPFDTAAKCAYGEAHVSRTGAGGAHLSEPRSVGMKRYPWTSNTSGRGTLHRSLDDDFSEQIMNSGSMSTDKRNVQMRLPFFDELGILPKVPPNHWLDRSSTPTVTLVPGSFGGSPLLTPPDEIVDVKWNTLSSGHMSAFRSLAASNPSLSFSHPVHTISSGDNSDRSLSQEYQSSVSHTGHQSRISLPSNTMKDQDQRGKNGQEWLDQALEQTAQSLATAVPPVRYIQMVAQLLPLRMNGASSAKPVFESVLEAIQDRIQSEVPPYITITHAVPHMIAMDDVPTSPPATPNAAQSSDYFDMPTVFSHAAVVPAYHSVANTLSTSTARPSNPVVAPASIHVSVLERYIPPTSSQEHNDFFTASSRSYLVDRLAELSADGGTLLLIYPTKSGAKTFTSNYLGPILEPLLRQFVFFNNLYTDVAQVLQEMTAVESMLDFEQMHTKITMLCSDLSKRGLPRSGPRSIFSIAHSGPGKAVLDGSTWRDAYIHQEQARLRRNLVEYQLRGGKMPQTVGNTEITHGMLVRQVTDGLRASREVAGGAAVELGLFVIRRTAA